MRFRDIFPDKQAIRFAIISFVLVTGALALAIVSASAAQVGEYELASLTSKIALLMAVLIAVYVVPRLARNVRLELLRTNLSLNITSAGWLFSTFILVVGIASLSTGNNLLYLVLATLLATLAVSGVASRLNINDTGVSLRFPDHIFAGEPTHLEIILSNQKRLVPSFSLSATITPEPEQRGFWKKKKEKSKLRAFIEKHAPLVNRTVNFAIVPGATYAQATVKGSFERRGVYPVNGFEIRSRFPFGFVERRRLIEAHGEIVVYPQPQLLDDYYHLLPITRGQLESPLKGSGSDLYAIRQYLRSDHLRHVDWKATAKTAQLMVREFTHEDDWRLTIALDSSARGQGNYTADEFAEKFEEAVTLTASLITHFMKEGAEVRLITGSDDPGFGRDEAHRYAMLRILAKLNPGQNADQSAQQTRQVLPGENSADKDTAWNLLERMPALMADDDFKILITPAQKGSIPASVWRATHVVYFDDLK